MPRATNAATVQRPGRATNAATDTDPASISGVEAAAQSVTVEDADALDPTALKQPVFDAKQGWVCPAPKTAAERSGNL
jgi:hypothetical protein